MPCICFCTTRHGVSGKELQRQLGVTYKTAYRIGQQIRDLTGDDYTRSTVQHGRKEYVHYDYRSGETFHVKTVKGF